MKKISIFALGLFLFFGIVAQDRETRQLDEFNEISVGEAIDVEIKAGNKEQCIVEVEGTGRRFLSPRDLTVRGGRSIRDLKSTIIVT